MEELEENTEKIYKKVEEKDEKQKIQVKKKCNNQAGYQYLNKRSSKNRFGGKKEERNFLRSNI